MSRSLLLIATAGLTLAAAHAEAQAPPPTPSSGSSAPVSSAAPAPASTPAPRGTAAPAPTASAPAASTPAPASTSAPATRGAAAANQPEYRIGSGDKLQINVYKETDLTQALQVRPDGRITMPLIGDLAAAGQTPMQLQRRLAESLKEFVSNPVVTVMVVEVAERVVYVMGEVTHPGPVPLKGQMTVLQALAVAGGFKDFANKGGIKVMRKVPGSDRVDNIPFSYKDALRSDTPVFYLIEGDTVVVP